MKRKQITAILMSAIMTVSACMPMNSMQALAAENADASGTAAAVVEEEQADSAQDTVEVEEPQSTEPETPAPAVNGVRAVQIVLMMKIPKRKQTRRLLMDRIRTLPKRPKKRQQRKSRRSWEILHRATLTMRLQFRPAM